MLFKANHERQCRETAYSVDECFSKSIHIRIIVVVVKNGKYLFRFSVLGLESLQKSQAMLMLWSLYLT